MQPSSINLNILYKFIQTKNTLNYVEIYFAQLLNAFKDLN
jgi:hypothetical protein